LEEGFSTDDDPRKKPLMKEYLAAPVGMGKLCENRKRGRCMALISKRGGGGSQTSKKDSVFEDWA